MPKHIKRSHRRLTLSVSMTLPASVGMAELREYVKDAVETWGGQRHPDDHLFYGCRDIAIKRVDQLGEAPKGYAYPMIWKATGGVINPEALTALRAEFDKFMGDARAMFAPLEED